MNSSVDHSITQMPPTVVHRSEQRKFANPSPLGLSAFALTTFLLSAANADLYHGSAIVLGCAAFYGGLVQLLAGMWDFVHNNIFGATALSSYGGFWMSYAFTVFFAEKTIANEKAVAFYLVVWTIFTFLMLVCTIVMSVAMVVLFTTLLITFVLLAAGAFHPDQPHLTKAGGYMGLLCATLAWYIAMSHLLEALDHPLRLPLFPLRKPKPVVVTTSFDTIPHAVDYSNDSHFYHADPEAAVRTPLTSEMQRVPKPPTKAHRQQNDAVATHA